MTHFYSSFVPSQSEIKKDSESYQNTLRFWLNITMLKINHVFINFSYFFRTFWPLLTMIFNPENPGIRARPIPGSRNWKMVRDPGIPGLQSLIISNGGGINEVKTECR